jgi:hypothetical protein
MSAQRPLLAQVAHAVAKVLLAAKRKSPQIEGFFIIKKTIEKSIF